MFRCGSRTAYSDSAVRYFLSITRNPTFSLAQKYEMYTRSHRVPKEMLPIAVDPGGNLVLLAIEGEDTGKVFFWNHEGKRLAIPS